LFVETGHIQDWIETHQALVLSSEHSARFDAALGELPWLPSTPDWRSIEHRRVHLDDADLWEQVTRTPVGTHEHAFFVWAADEPGLVAPLRRIIRDIDVLTWHAAGWRFFCGAHRDRGRWALETGDFGAYPGGDHLTLRLR
jgi:hypothetical protein